MSVALLFGVLLSAHASAQGPATGTTVFRCISAAGTVRFSDRPCRESVSERLRIEHATVQSAPLSIADQQRLNALSERLQLARSEAERRRALHQRLQSRRAEAAASRCRTARAALTELRTRKRRGYPAKQAVRIDAEERALNEDIRLHCAGP